MNCAVSVRLDHFTYPGYEEPVLKDVDFSIRYGEVTLLSGLSGCGKSTLLSVINGVIPRMTGGELDGQVLVDGEDIKDHSMSRISQKVGSVLQNAESQIINQVVEDEVAFGCENFGVAPAEIEERVDRACGTMGLEKDWRTRTLSGGQKQRLITASTLAMDPKILIFDEPLANLDQAGALELLKILRSLADGGKAVLIAEHRLDVILPYVDTAWALEGGTPRLVTDRQAYLEDQIGAVRDNPRCRLESGEPLLEVSHLQKSFSGRPVLMDLDLEVREGERLLLLGENGCGKSTLLQILARLMKADAGQIRQRIDPREMSRADKAWFRSVGVVYQNPNYQLFMSTVREELAFGAEDQDYVEDLAERFGLTDILERHPQSLSEGQKRRVTIAAILAQKPKLLLLDEPTVGQDYDRLQRMVDVVNQVHAEQGNTMISVTHDFRCAAALCDRAVWIDGGRVIRTGARELTEAFFHRNGEHGPTECGNQPETDGGTGNCPNQV